MSHISPLVISEELSKFDLLMLTGGFSESTRRTYVKNVESFLLWHTCNYPTVDIVDVQWDEMRRYSCFMQQSLKGNTVNSYMSAIHKYFEGIVEREWNRAAMPSVSYAQYVRNVPNDTDVTTIIRHAATLRDALIYSLMATSGLRLSEVLRLRYRDIIENRRALYIAPSKNHYDRCVPLEPNVLAGIIRYYHSLPYPRPGKDDYIFPSTWGSRSGSPLSEGGVERKFKALVASLGMESKGYSPHSLRHYFGTELYAAGKELQEIAVLMGHNQVTSTVVYARRGAVRRFQRTSRNMFQHKLFDNGIWR